MYRDSSNVISHENVVRLLAQVRSHRVDRKYFMSGSKAAITAKFDVDKLDLDRLRDMAVVRKDTPYYGRGLRFDTRSKFAALPEVIKHLA